jgi:predicted negative regulator of RcsB-dependent stress response
VSQSEDFADRVASLIAKHWALVTGAFALLILAVAAALGFQWWQDSQEKAAREDIFQAEQPLYKLRDENDKKSADKALKDAQAKKDAAKKDSKAQPKEDEAEPDLPQVADFSKDYLPKIEPVKAAILRNAGRKVALTSALALAQFVEDQKHPDVGIDVLEKTLQTAKPSELFFVLAKVELGNLYAETAQYEKAKNHYTELVNSQSAKFMLGEVLLRLGLCAQKLGQMDQAKAMYNRVVTEFSGTDAANSAKNFLRLLQFESARSEQKGS